jgi:PIN domain nuclease of toxin-antitoxin system
VNGLLLDTHVFLWYSSSDAKLPATIREQIENTTSPIYLSWASAWEIAIKLGIGKLDLPQPIADLLALDEHGIEWLPLEAREVVAYSELGFPLLDHRDPFDRMLAVQAAMNRLVLLTADQVFESYLPAELLQRIPR